MKRRSALCFALAAGLGSAAYSATPAEIAIPGERVFPESLTSTRNGTVIIGSIGAKTIYRAKPGSANAEVWIHPGTDGMQSIFGVFADDESNTLYACSGGLTPAPGQPRPIATLYTFDLETGAPKGHYPLPTAGGSCNDIALGADGTAYVTDTSNMEVVRLTKGSKALEVWAGSHGEFGPKGGVLDGIAVLGDHVIVNALLTSKLFSAPIGKDGRAGTVAEIKLQGSITRPDGMRSLGKSSLLVAEAGSGAGRLSRVDLSGTSGKVMTVKDGFPGGPVAVTVVGDTAYVLEGQLGVLFRGDESVKTEPFRAVAVPVGTS
jgi:sugar lactone lactonase YvrE